MNSSCNLKRFLVPLLLTFSATAAHAEICVQNNTVSIVRVLRAVNFSGGNTGPVEIVREADRFNLAPAELKCLPDGKGDSPNARRIAFHLYPDITDMQRDALAPQFSVTELPLPHDASASIHGDVENPQLTVQSHLRPVFYGKLLRLIDR